MSIDRVAANGHISVLLERAAQLQRLLAPVGPEPLSGENEEAFRQTFRDLRARMADLEAAIGEREQTSTFAEFFGNVGDALVQAQRALDAHTQTYLQEVAGRRNLLPAVFRIPTLSADIRFSLEKASEDRLNVIFHSRGQEARELNQQTIHFEIIAAPPPPEAVGGAEPAGWRPDVVLSPSERQSIVSTLRFVKMSSRVKQEERDALEQELLSHPDAILIVRGDAPERYFLIYARGIDPKNVGVWELDRASEPPALSPAYRYTRVPTADERDGMAELQRQLSAACAAQEELLRRLSGGPT